MRGQALDGILDRCQLNEHVITVCVVFDHFTDAVDLTVDSVESVDDALLFFRASLRFLFATIIGAFICKIGQIPQNIASDIQITLPLVIGIGIFTCITPYFLYTLALKKIPDSSCTPVSTV